MTAGHTGGRRMARRTATEMFAPRQSAPQLQQQQRLQRGTTLPAPGREALPADGAVTGGGIVRTASQTFTIDPRTGYNMKRWTPLDCSTICHDLVSCHVSSHMCPYTFDFCMPPATWNCANQAIATCTNLVQLCETGRQMNFGPALTRRAACVELPALTRLFQNIKSAPPSAKTKPHPSGKSVRRPAKSICMSRHLVAGSSACSALIIRSVS